MPYYTVHHRNDIKLSAEQQKLKDQLVAAGQEWTPTWHNILILDPSYFSAYLNLRKAATGKNALSHKVQELILLAMDASCTHLYEPGIRAHTANALRAGASRGEIIETLELTSTLGVHAMNVGVPLLQEVLAEHSGSHNAAAGSVSSAQEKIREEFKVQRGYWNASWDPVLTVAPDFLSAYTAFSSVPYRQGTHNHLDPKTRELIFVAVDCQITHLHQPSIKQHIRNAIQLGATQEEIVEVFQLACLMGVQTMIRGADVLTDELLEREKK